MKKNYVRRDGMACKDHAEYNSRVVDGAEFKCGEADPLNVRLALKALLSYEHRWWTAAGRKAGGYQECDLNAELEEALAELAGEPLEVEVAHTRPSFKTGRVTVRPTALKVAEDEVRRIIDRLDREVESWSFIAKGLKDKHLTANLDVATLSRQYDVNLLRAQGATTESMFVFWMSEAKLLREEIQEVCAYRTTLGRQLHQAQLLVEESKWEYGLACVMAEKVGCKAFPGAWEAHVAQQAA